MPTSTYDLIVKNLNKANQTTNPLQKRNYLLQIKEFIATSDKSYLDNFFEEIIAFKDDSDLEIRKVVVEFTQVACKLDSSFIKRCIECLANLYVSSFHLQSFPVQLLTSIIEAVIPIYRLALGRVVKIGLIDSGAVSGSGIERETAASLSFDVFSMCHALKDEISRLFIPSVVEESTHGSMMTPPPIVLKELCSNLPEVLRIKIISLIKSVIIVQSRRTQKSEIPTDEEENFCLNSVPDITDTLVKAVLANSSASCCKSQKPSFHLIRSKRLCDESERLLSGLIAWTLQGGGGASSNKEKVNEIAFELVPITVSVLEYLLDALVEVACQRPQFFNKILQAFETLHVNLPPRFLETQVNQIRKKLKTGLLHLLRHPAVNSDIQTRITILLTDLGATQTEVVQALQTRRKASAKVVEESSDKKELFDFDEEDDFADSDDVESSEKTRVKLERKNRDYKKALENPQLAKLPTSWPEIDDMVQKLVPKLSIANVADLVLLSMVSLPRQMPAAFNSTYTPIAAAGTTAQINHLARLMATQLSVWGTENLTKCAAQSSQNPIKKKEDPGNAQACSELKRHLLMLANIFECLPRQASTKKILITSQVADKISSNEEKQKPIQSLNMTASTNNESILQSDPSMIFMPPPLIPQDIQIAMMELDGNVQVPILDSISNFDKLPTSALRTFSVDCFNRVLSSVYHGHKDILLPNELYCHNAQLWQEEEFSSSERPKLSGMIHHEIARLKLLTRIPSQVLGTRDLYSDLIDYALADKRQSLELLSLLLMQEYQRYKGFQVEISNIKNRLGKRDAVAEWENDDEDDTVIDTAEKNLLGSFNLYDSLLCNILSRLNIRLSLFPRFFLEIPLITDQSLSFLRNYCCKDEQAKEGLGVLRQLIEMRPIADRNEMLQMLLEFASNDSPHLRSLAMRETRNLITSSLQWRQLIFSKATKQFQQIINPPSNFTEESSALERFCIQCSSLFMSIIPCDPDTHLSTLASVYIKAAPTVKRQILKLIDPPIFELGIHNDAFLRLIDTCPPGSETMITRMLHLLLDQNSSLNSPPIMPPKSVVDCVRRLYTQRSPDIRCLLPVLVGLSRNEVLAALPSLVQLQDRLVKEVLNRLLRASVACKAIPRKDGTIDDADKRLGPISPEDLLVAIHQLEFIDFSKTTDGKKENQRIELKIILRACLHCFNEKKFFTQERLSLAISQLIQLDPVPTLTMRTVMQALAMFPRLAGLVITVLARLAVKQIWKNSALWDGFVRCCMKTRPLCYQVLLQLPLEQLESVFTKEPSLRNHMLRFAENLTSTQRSQFAHDVMKILERTEDSLNNDTLEDQMKEGENSHKSSDDFLSPSSKKREFTTDEDTDENRHVKIPRNEDDDPPTPEHEIAFT